MSKLALTLREKLPVDVFTDNEIVNLIEGSSHRRYSLVKRALAQGDLIQLRRGVYCFGKVFQRGPLDQFKMAYRIYPPSYVSFESALSHHGWIPEAVYTITCASLKRTTIFETPLGNFSYTKIPNFNYIGVDWVDLGNEVKLIASPTKAISDYIIAHKLDFKGKELMDYLRIEEDSWEQLSCELLLEIAKFTRCVRIRKFLKSLRKDIEF